MFGRKYPKPDPAPKGPLRFDGRKDAAERNDAELQAVQTWLIARGWYVAREFEDRGARALAWHHPHLTGTFLYLDCLDTWKAAERQRSWDASVEAAS